MKISRCFAILAFVGAILAFVGFSPLTALADGIPDPHFIPIGGTGSTIITQDNLGALQFSFIQGTTATESCNSVPGSPASFGADTCINHNVTEFVNDTGATWTSITFKFPTFSPGSLVFKDATDNAAFDPYFAHSTSGISDGTPFVTFFGTDATHPGIESATSCGDGCVGPSETFNDSTIYLFDFSMLTDIQDILNAGITNAQFDAKGSVTEAPEPPTFLLFVAGLVFLFLVGKNRRIPNLNFRL